MECYLAGLDEKAFILLLNFFASYKKLPYWVVDLRNLVYYFYRHDIFNFNFESFYKSHRMKTKNVDKALYSNSSIMIGFVKFEIYRYKLNETVQKMDFIFESSSVLKSCDL